MLTDNNVRGGNQACLMFVCCPTDDQASGHVMLIADLGQALVRLESLYIRIARYSTHSTAQHKMNRAK